MSEEMDELKIVIDDDAIYKVFTTIAITSLLISLDHGIIPAASVQISSSLGLRSEELGLLGSLVYGGIVIMGFLASFVYLHCNPQRVIQVSIVGMMLGLLIFTLEFDQKWVYYLSRFITGAAQAPLLVYFPVWVDTFGRAEKTLWLTILQSGVPFGVFIGYVVSSIIAQYNWKMSFYLQIAILLPSLVILSRESLVNIDIRPRLKQSAQQFDKMSYWTLLKIVLSCKSYALLTMCMGILFFCVTGIQFWISNYLIEVLHYEQSLVNTVFSIVSISGPTLGCVLGGSITQHYGGYDCENAYYIATIAAFLGSVTAMIVPFTDNFSLISILIWILLFFGGALVPILTGIILTSVNPGLRSFASSTTTTYVNLFGYLPAPVVYGYLATISPRLAILTLMLSPMFGCLMLCYVTICIYINRQNTLVQVQIHDVQINNSGNELNSQQSKLEQFSQRFRAQSEDYIEQVIQFHSTPLQTNIISKLQYQSQ